jgi:hypothetical protein
MLRDRLPVLTSAAESRVAVLHLGITVPDGVDGRSSRPSTAAAHAFRDQDTATRCCNREAWRGVMLDEGAQRETRRVTVMRITSLCMPPTTPSPTPGDHPLWTDVGGFWVGLATAAATLVAVGLALWIAHRERQERMGAEAERDALRSEQHKAEREAQARRISGWLESEATDH